MDDETLQALQTLQTLEITWPTQDAWLGNKVLVKGRAVPQKPQQLIVQAKDTYYLSNVNGNWEVEAALDGMQYPSFFISASLRDPAQSVSVHVHWQRYADSKATILSPEDGTYFAAGQPIELEGVAVTVGTVTVTDEVGKVLGTAVPGAFGVWKMTISPTAGANAITIKAAQVAFGGSPEPSPPRTFHLSAPVAITAPAEGSLQPQTFTISGTSVVAGGLVEILKDRGDNTSFGSGPVRPEKKWDARVTVAPGPVSLVAEQVIAGGRFGRSAARHFNIRPSTLGNVTVTPQPNETVKFSGAGFTSATVKITKVSGPGGQTVPPVTVVGGQWQVTVSNWLPGVYTMSALQEVSDGAGGWIPSEPYPFTFTTGLPSPTEVTYTKDYTPTFSGKGYNGATVYLMNPGGGSAAAPEVVVVNGAWSSRASQAWGPTNKRLVHLQQRLNGQSSPGWVETEVTIPPLPPVITDVIENELSPTLKGTCWPGAVVRLTFSDSATEHNPPGASGVWECQRSTPFAPEVVHTVTVTQTAAGQTSPSTSRTFTVHKPLHKPVITSPQQDEEVGRDLIIQGKDGVAGATMKLRDAQFDRPLGQPKLLNQDGDWSIELKNLEFRKYTVDATQAIGPRESPSSAPRSFEVVVLSPKFEVPSPGGDLPRDSTLSGSGIPGAKVTVWLQGVAEPLHIDLPVDKDGHWEGNVRLPVGNAVIWARQTFEGRPSKDTPLLAFRVAPNVPFIETPAKDERVGRQAVVSGFGYPGDTVKVMLADAPQAGLGQAQVLDDRTWSVSVTLDRPGGTHRLMAVQSRDGFVSRASERPISLGSYPPTIDVPAQGRWVTDPVGFAGQGRPGTGELVSWFNPDLKLASNIPVTAQGWQHSVTQPLPGGGYRVRFRQTIQGETGGSDWADSERFEVAPSKTQV